MLMQGEMLLIERVYNLRLPLCSNEIDPPRLCTMYSRIEDRRYVFKVYL